MERSVEKEKLDDDRLLSSGTLVAQAYSEMAKTQRWLGNTSAILRRLRNHPGSLNRVLDIGCGHGALLQQIRHELGVEVVGFDLRTAPQSAPVAILTGDATKDPLPLADVAISACVAHHLSPQENIRLIQNASRSCRRLIILDLVRHRLPLALFRTFVHPWLSEISASDGLTSIRRAYTPREFREITASALGDTGALVIHSVSPLYIRQIIDITWV